LVTGREDETVTSWGITDGHPEPHPSGDIRMSDVLFVQDLDLWAIAILGHYGWSSEHLRQDRLLIPQLRMPIHDVIPPLGCEDDEPSLKINTTPKEAHEKDRKSLIFSLVKGTQHPVSISHCIPSVEKSQWKRRLDGHTAPPCTMEGLPHEMPSVPA